MTHIPSPGSPPLVHHFYWSNLIINGSFNVLTPSCFRNWFLINSLSIGWRYRWNRFVLISSKTLCSSDQSVKRVCGEIIGEKPTTCSSEQSVKRVCVPSLLSKTKFSEDRNFDPIKSLHSFKHFQLHFGFKSCNGFQKLRSMLIYIYHFPIALAFKCHAHNTLLLLYLPRPIWCINILFADYTQSAVIWKPWNAKERTAMIFPLTHLPKFGVLTCW